MTLLESGQNKDLICMFKKMDMLSMYLKDGYCSTHFYIYIKFTVQSKHLDTFISLNFTLN